MAEPVGSEYQVRWLEEKVRLMQGTIDYVESMVEGLNYELRVRDFRIRELEQENARLRKRLEEQAPPPQPPSAHVKGTFIFSARPSRGGIRAAPHFASGLFRRPLPAAALAGGRGG